MRATTRCTPNVSRARRAEMMFELSPEDTAANAPASSMPALNNTSRSKPMPSTRSPGNSGESRWNADASRSMIATSCPIRDKPSASDAPTRPQPITTTRNLGPFQPEVARELFGQRYSDAAGGPSVGARVQAIDRRAAAASGTAVPQRQIGAHLAAEADRAAGLRIRRAFVGGVRA